MASVELEMTPVCHARWHAAPVCGPTCDYFHTIARCRIWLGNGLYGLLRHIGCCCWYSRNSTHAAACVWKWKGFNGIQPTISCCVNIDSRSLFRGLMSLFLFSFRTFPMMTLRWSSMWILLTVWWWRATCLKGLAMPSRPGTGRNKAWYTSM